MKITQISVTVTNLNSDFHAVGNRYMVVQITNKKIKNGMS